MVVGVVGGCCLWCCCPLGRVVCDVVVVGAAGVGVGVAGVGVEKYTQNQVTTIHCTVTPKLFGICRALNERGQAAEAGAGSRDKFRDGRQAGGPEVSMPGRPQTTSLKTPCNKPRPCSGPDLW